MANALYFTLSAVIFAFVAYVVAMAILMAIVVPFGGLPMLHVIAPVIVAICALGGIVAASMNL